VRAYNARYEYGPTSAEVAIDLAAPTATITAVLQANNTALVTWSTTNAASVVINGTAVGASGSAAVGISATTTFTITATSSSGATATASATVTLGVPASPTAPQSLTGTVSGSRATLAWRAPSGGGAPSNYLIYAGTTVGATNVANGLSVGNVLSAYGDLPKGRYYIRVRAANGVGMSPDSNSITLRIGKQLASPNGFKVTWVGTTATLSWTAPAGATAEDVPTNFILEAGTAPGQSDVATVGLGTTTTFSADVSSGTYYVRVRSTNDYGESDPTADLMLVAPGAPKAPSGLFATGIGHNVDLRWVAASGGVAATSYLIEAGSAPGLSDLGRFPIGNVLKFSAVAPSGVYYVRVRGVNSRGGGEPSNEIIVRR
jgi:predicted phage tail protein